MPRGFDNIITHLVSHTQELILLCLIQEHFQSILCIRCLFTLVLAELCYHFDKTSKFLSMVTKSNISGQVYELSLIRHEIKILYIPSV